ncbi:hypothetical protein LguiB_004117 [Lonicera macranthoides]
MATKALNLLSTYDEYKYMVKRISANMDNPSWIRITQLSQSDQTPASPFSSSSLTSNSDSELNEDEDEVSSYLEVASSKYPNLIGTTAFVGRITEDVVEEWVKDGRKGVRSWVELELVDGGWEGAGRIVVVVVGIKGRAGLYESRDKTRCPKDFIVSLRAGFPFKREPLFFLAVKESDRGKKDEIVERTLNSTSTPSKDLISFVCAYRRGVVFSTLGRQQLKDLIHRLRCINSKSHTSSESLTTVDFVAPNS